MPASPSGTRFTYVGTWNGQQGYIGTTSPITDSSATVSDSLRASGLLVEDSTISDPSFWSLNGKATVTFSVLDQVGHADLDDARRVIDHMFYVVMNRLPDGSRISDYTLPSGQQQSTGAAPASPANGAGGAAGDCTNWLGFKTQCDTTSGNVAKTAGYVALAVIAAVTGFAIFKFGGLVKPA